MTPYAERLAVIALIRRWHRLDTINGTDGLLLANLFGFGTYEELRSAHGSISRDANSEHISKGMQLLLGPHGKTVYKAMLIKRGLKLSTYT